MSGVAGIAQCLMLICWALCLDSGTAHLDSFFQRMFEDIAGAAPRLSGDLDQTTMEERIRAADLSMSVAAQRFAIRKWDNAPTVHGIQAALQDELSIRMDARVLPKLVEDALHLKPGDVAVPRTPIWSGPDEKDHVEESHVSGYIHAVGKASAKFAQDVLVLISAHRGYISPQEWCLIKHITVAVQSAGGGGKIAADLYATTRDVGTLDEAQRRPWSDQDENSLTSCFDMYEGVIRIKCNEFKPTSYGALSQLMETVVGRQERFKPRGAGWVYTFSRKLGIVNEGNGGEEAEEADDTDEEDEGGLADGSYEPEPEPETAGGLDLNATYSISHRKAAGGFLSQVRHHSKS